MANYVKTFMKARKCLVNKCFRAFLVPNELLTLKLQQVLQGFYVCKLFPQHPCLYAPSSYQYTSYLPLPNQANF